MSPQTAKVVNIVYIFQSENYTEIKLHSETPEIPKIQK